MLQHLKQWKKDDSGNAAAGKWRLGRLQVNGELEMQGTSKVTCSL